MVFTFKNSISKPNAVNWNNHRKKPAKHKTSYSLVNNFRDTRKEEMRGKVWSFLNGQGYKTRALYKCDLKIHM